jgi:hypothetical protein
MSIFMSHKCMQREVKIDQVCNVFALSGMQFLIILCYVLYMQICDVVILEAKNPFVKAHPFLNYSKIVKICDVNGK